MTTERPPKRLRTENGSSSFARVHRPHKPSARAQAGQGRLYTISVALPGSILLNAQTDVLKAVLTGQLARTCAIFGVNEIVIFHEEPASADVHVSRKKGAARSVEDAHQIDRHMVLLLEYLETPQHFRKKLFAIHPSLAHAGLLPPLDLPHHVRKSDIVPYREGVVLDLEDVADKKGRQTARVDVGFDDPLALKATNVQAGMRVTVRMPVDDKEARLVSSSEPLRKSGLYWGYTVRHASSISRIFTESPWRGEQDEANLGGYDLTIGTSERGIAFDDMQESAQRPFRHALVVLGGLSGLELTIAADPDLGLAAEDAADLFDFWVNVCPNQGSRTIRTEEALSIALARLRPLFEAQGEMS